MFACLSSPSTPIDVLERLARDFSPRIEIPGASQVLIDVSGLASLLGEPHEIAEALRAACLQLRPAKAGHYVGSERPAEAGHYGVGIAIAGTRIAAQLLAVTTPRVVVVPPGAEATAIASLPLGTLAFLGAPPDLLSILDRWGLGVLGDLAALPSTRLSSRIGQHGLLWQRMARGEDARPLVPALPEERFETVFDLEWPIEGLEPLAFVLGRMLDPLCAQLERRDRAAAVVELRLRLAVSRTWRLRRLELPTPIRDVRMLRTLLCLDLEGHPEALNEDGSGGAGGGTFQGIDRLGLFIEPTPGRIAQGSLLTRPTISPEAAATLVARLRALMGHDRCGIARLVDTHRAGAFTMGDFTPDGKGCAYIPEHKNPRAPDLKIGPALEPTPPARSLRRLRHPIPARVSLDHGRPIRVSTDRRGWSGGRVTWCAGPWRSSGDWWRTEARQETALPYSWQEWDVALNDGAQYRIHEDRLRAQWFVNGVLD